MSLIYCTGFDRSTNIYDYFVISTGGGTANFTTGRFGNGVYVERWHSNHYVVLDLKNTYSELIIGFAIKFNTSNMLWDFIRFLDSNNNISTFNFSCGIGSNFNLYIYNGTNGYGSSAYLYPGIWYYIEIKTKFHNSNGYVNMRVNSQQVLNQTGIKTSTSLNHCKFIAFYADSDRRIFDDLYICDTSGTKNNDFLGDIKVITLFPTRDGTYNDFNVVGASSNYEAVDETSPNSDTDYVTQSGINLRQTFGFTAPTISGSVLGLRANHFIRKDDAGSRFVQLLGKYGTSEDLSSSISLLDTYTYYSKIYETRIGSSQDWSINDLNDVEFGVKIVES